MSDSLPIEDLAKFLPPEILMEYNKLRQKKKEEILEELTKLLDKNGYLKKDTSS